MGFIKTSIKSILRNMFGFEVFWARNLPPYAFEFGALQLVSSLRKFEIDLVLEVGANKGSVRIRNTSLRVCGQNRVFRATFSGSQSVAAILRGGFPVGCLPTLRTGRPERKSKSILRGILKAVPF